MNEMLNRMRAVAINAAHGAGKAAETVSSAAQNVYESARLRMKMFDINTDIELLYRDIGKNVYMTHTGQEIDSTEIETKIKAIEEKLAEIDAIKLTLHTVRITCETCGADAGGGDLFCPKCGERL